ncbi:MAG: DUF4124 domain-containing protein [Gammaproteobacteria bacterium]|nr:DUF4124 domain-containing protein [Gammaproteobacteria bacterium]
MMPRTLLTISIALLIPFVAQAKMYRWVDEKGGTVYSQSPPPSGQATEIAPPPPPATNSQEQETQRLNKAWQEMQDREEARDETDTVERETAETNEIKQKNCQAARHNLSILQGPTNRLIKQADGEYKRFTQEEREAQISDIQQKIEEFCE